LCQLDIHTSEAGYTIENSIADQHSTQISDYKIKIRSFIGSNEELVGLTSEHVRVKWCQPHIISPENRFLGLQM
jgi:hypothetical protein